MFHDVTRELTTSIESLRAAHDIDVQLLLHDDLQTPAARADSVVTLLGAVDDASRFTQSAEEQRQVMDLREAIDAYLRGGKDADVAPAFRAARRLWMINAEGASQLAQRAVLMNQVSNFAGASAAISLLIGVAAFVLWLRRGPSRQIARLSDAMDRFGSGDLDARAPDEAGPQELVKIARAFNATASALIRARQRQIRYVSTAMHDLRTPLTAIQLAVGYVSPGRPLPPESRIRELVELIGKQLTRLNGAIGDILNATWIEAGEMPLLRSQFDLRSVASESVKFFRELAPDHVIDLKMPAEPLAIRADRPRLEQVLNNLLSNAIKYSPLGSHVRVRLTRLPTATGVDALTMEVSDEGPGVSPEDRARIFETFERQSATHAEAAGTSLGLWVSRRVVEAHGGRIELDSQVGRGATFRVTLPAEPRTTTAPVPTEEPAQLAQPRLLEQEG